MINYSIIGYVFIVDEFMHYYSLLRYHLKIERTLEVINGTPMKSENIIHMTKISLCINSYKERLPGFIMHLGHYLLVLEKL